MGRSDAYYEPDWKFKISKLFRHFKSRNSLGEYESINLMDFRDDRAAPLRSRG